VNDCSGDETLKPQASVQRGSISSDEENEVSLDVSSRSDSEDESSAVSSGEDRPEHHAEQVCTVY